MSRSTSASRTLQANGETTQAANMAARLPDPSALGAILAQLYLSPDYITKPAELTAWWDKYSGEPEAPAIYALMQHKLRRADLPARPADHPAARRDHDRRGRRHSGFRT